VKLSLLTASGPGPVGQIERFSRRLKSTIPRRHRQDAREREVDGGS
jgi:hypothetical protein